MRRGADGCRKGGVAEIRYYQDLKVWQMGMALVPRIYEIARQLPKEELFALGGQMRRAAVSVPSNIAEGRCRAHTREFLQHLGIARGSLAELETLLLVAHNLNYIAKPEALLADLESLRRALHGLTSALSSRLRSPLTPHPTPRI
ncbi:MAG: four helix bundle protein [Terriglobales bacterium]